MRIQITRPLWGYIRISKPLIIITKISNEIDRQENYNQDNNNEDNSIMKTMTVKTTATGSDMPSTSCVIQRPNFGVNSIY